MKFIEKLESTIRKNNSLLCIGLDPQRDFLPQTGDIFTRLTDWGKSLVELTADLVCCYKPNIAFFEQFGPSGLHALQEIVSAVPDGIPVILDAKRGDIGSTAEAYTHAVYDQFHVDAVTLNPYLGKDSIRPFVQDPDKAVFILCQTSNPSAAEVQNHGSPPLFEYVAQLSQSWGTPDQIGLVIGATQPDALKRVRSICPDCWFLAPGIGAQGGDLRQALTAGLRSDKLGMIIPVSRSVLTSEDPRKTAQKIQNEINKVREDVEINERDPFSHLVAGLFETGCVKFGNFTLASGLQSPVYLDLRRLVSFPEVLDLAVEAYIDQLVSLNYDCVAGVPYAALPIASIAAFQLKRPMIYPRKEAKTHGTGQMIEGVFSKGQTAVLLEDVITSGGSILTAANTLREAELLIKDVVVLVDREQGGKAVLADQGIAVHAVLTMTSILNLLLEEKRIDQSTFHMVREYLASSK